MIAPIDELAMSSEQNNDNFNKPPSRPGIVQGIDDRIAQKSRRAMNSASQSKIVDGLDERIQKKSQMNVVPSNPFETTPRPMMTQAQDFEARIQRKSQMNMNATSASSFRASSRAEVMQDQDHEARIQRKSQTNIAGPSVPAQASSRPMIPQAQDFEARVQRKSQMNMNATSKPSIEASSRSTVMQDQDHEARIQRKSQTNITAPPVSIETSSRSMNMPFEERIMNKSRQGLSESSESRQSSKNVEINDEKENIVNETEKYEKKASVEFDVPPTPKGMVRFDEGTKLPMYEKDVEKGKSKDAPERILPKTTSTASMFLSFHRIKKKKKKEKEVDSNEILKADFAFVDTYDSHNSTKMKLLEETEEDLEPMVQANASLAHLCNDFFRGTGFVGLLIMAALVCSIVIPISKARNKAIMMRDYPTLHPTSQPTSSEYIPIFNEIRRVTNEQTLHDQDSPQHNAFQWIVSEDPMQMSHEDPALLQRYALVVFYFANGGPRWFKNEGWLSGEDVCKWDHVTCESFDIVTNQGIVTGLDFYNMGLYGILPSEIGQLTSLKSLTLAGNKLFGTIPSQLYNLGRLENLLLNRNKFEGTLSEDIKLLKEIKIFAVSENEMSGTIPNSITQCSSLTELYLHTNNFTGKIPAHLSRLINLELLDMAKNSFTGTLQPDMMNLSKLAFLEMSFNDLSGSIPTEFGGMKTLRRLKLSYNKLTGPLPTQLGALDDLIYISLESNLDLSGQIPTEIGNLSKLISIDFGQCSFSGTLPTELGELSSLSYLNLFNNKISGTIPTEMGKMINLKESRLQYTNLEGEVPNQFCALRSQSLLLLQADCADKLSCDERCCTRCSIPT